MIKISGYLAGHLLVALPQDNSEESHETVIFICKHDKEGAMGFVINQVLDTIVLSDLLYQMVEEGDILPDPFLQDPPVFWGGPVDINRGFVLHSLDFQNEHTMVIGNQCGITAHFDILKAILKGEDYPEHFIMLLGYAGWKAGQLEEEIAHNPWVLLPCKADFLFTVPWKDKWSIAMNQLDTNLLSLAPIQGEA